MYISLDSDIKHIPCLNLPAYCTLCLIRKTLSKMLKAKKQHNLSLSLSAPVSTADLFYS
jgi:hypothetical protein